MHGEYEDISHGYKHLVCMLTCLMEPVFIGACYSCCCDLAVKTALILYCLRSLVLSCLCYLPISFTLLHVF